MAININSGVEDAFYRYKMPKLEAKVEGKGNGIKTVIVNASKIGNSLSRDPVYVTKYFGCELGAQINIDEKNDRYIVNGSHEASKLQTLLDGFIRKFVLCQSCNNPETVLSVKKGTDVKTKCKACGASSILNHGHRLVQFIVKHPPTKDRTTTQPDNDKNGSGEAGKNPLISTEKPLITPEDEDDDWGEDASDEAKRKRMEELTTMAQSMAMSNDVEKSSKEKLQIFLRLINKHRDEDTLVKHAKMICAEADKLDLDTKALLVFIEGALTNLDNVVQDVKKYATVFKDLINECQSKVKAEVAVLAGLVLLIGVHYDTLMDRSALLLKTLYDEDIVSEEVILKWAEEDFVMPTGVLSKKVMKEYEKYSSTVVQKAGVFINWLKEAEEESSDEQGSEESEQEDSGTEVDDDEEVKTSDQQKKGYEMNGNSKADVQVKQEDDDLDIDAI